ncbi:hypothetical protein FB45DRAFT_750453 [Roridomyces roridus]|uniref:Uncharacterized protein n=1 Tax=Roridomyces roridus TaxID=1738132 RepID=A0AAD7BNR6_9AGAR|nr:hypothetical protein FB45DRAFT_750453 [Roridomyces roridus]
MPITPAPTAPERPPATPQSDPMGITDDEPPAYTPGPDVYHGESTLEVGPARPFQTAVAAPRQQQQQYAPRNLHPRQRGFGGGGGSLWRQLRDEIIAPLTGPQYASSSSGWSSYPGQQRARQYVPPPMPPPRQQQQQQQPPVVSEFARDFYATADVPDTVLLSDASSARYPPPPGPPPNSEGGIPDDGRPTTMPMAGHPLLRDGNMLVYPPHHECNKCDNTGYKNADPTHPCTKCWERYARPYAGAVTYAPSSSPSSSASSSPSLPGTHSSVTFQRPLPQLYTPPSHARSRSADDRPLYPPPPPPAIPPQLPARPPPQGAAPPPRHPHLPPQGLVLPPGDPRLGGMLCYRCGGRGAINFLMFEGVPCGSCRGVGRVY